MLEYASNPAKSTLNLLSGKAHTAGAVRPLTKNFSEW